MFVSHISHPTLLGADMRASHEREYLTERASWYLEMALALASRGRSGESGTSVNLSLKRAAVTTLPLLQNVT